MTPNLATLKPAMNHTIPAINNSVLFLTIILSYQVLLYEVDFLLFQDRLPQFLSVRSDRFDLIYGKSRVFHVFQQLSGNRAQIIQFIQLSDPVSFFTEQRGNDKRIVQQIKGMLAVIFSVAAVEGRDQT